MVWGKPQEKPQVKPQEKPFPEAFPRLDADWLAPHYPFKMPNFQKSLPC